MADAKTEDEGIKHGAPTARTDGIVPGAVIDDRYVLIEPLGEGAMGSVWEARHLMLGSTVAVKLPTLSGAVPREYSARTLRELQVIGRMRHPGIVRVLDAGHFGAGYYAVMERLVGEDLGRYLDRFAPLPIVDVVRFGLRIATALAHAHSHGVIHRDLKPSNIFCCADGRVKLLDFGLAKPANAEPLTQIGVALGTPHYMSPEQMRGMQSVSAATDVYALGVVLYEMLTAATPFPGDDAIEVFERVLIGKFTPLSAVRPEAPRTLRYAVEQALRSAPSSRPPLRQMVEVLHQLAEGL